MHPSARLRGVKSDLLKGRTVVLAVSGSIAAVEAVRIAHEIIRHGANVVPVMTRAAAGLITPAALEYATGHPPILELTGRGEHVELCGGGRGSADALLVAPATANTIAKIALGVDDTAVTSCASVALGAGVPVLVAPAMHEVMGTNPAVVSRLKELRRMGAHVIEPRVEEEKAKIATPETIADAVIHRLAKGPWVGKRVLVISGSTAEPIDPARVVTNRSTGRMGTELAGAAYHRGAQVDLWNAWGAVPLPPFASTRRFETVEQLVKLVKSADLSAYAAILVPAALSDFRSPPARQKISSEAGGVTLRLTSLPKVLPLLRKKAGKSVLVGFKVESEPKLLLPKAQARLKDYKADLFVANLDHAFGADSAEAWLVGWKGKPRKVAGPKSKLAHAILDEVAKRF